MSGYAKGWWDGVALRRILRIAAILGVWIWVPLGLVAAVRYVIENEYIAKNTYNLAFFALWKLTNEAYAGPAFYVFLFFVLLFAVYMLFRVILHRRMKADHAGAGLFAAAFLLVALAAAGLLLRREAWYPSIHTTTGLVTNGLVAAFFIALIPLAYKWRGFFAAAADRAASSRVAGALSRPAIIIVPLLFIAFLNGAYAVRLSFVDREGKNFLFITVDTLRADHLGCYGYMRDTSPAIDRLASESFLFDYGIAQWPKTSPSFASIMTGTYGGRNGVMRLCRQRVRREFTLLGEALRQENFRTSGIVTNANVGEEFYFEQGFEDYVQVWKMPASARGELEEAEIVGDQAVRWLRKKGGKGKFFLWVHFIDPHAPYTPPPPFHEKFVGDEYYGSGRHINLNPGRDVDMFGIPKRSRIGEVTELDYYIAEYDAEILYTDTQIGRILDALRELGVYDNTLIILTADHGESLGDHNYYFEHGRLPYDACSRVPLIVRMPGPSAKGRTVARPVELINILPTALDILGAPIPEEAQGISMKRFLEGDETELPERAFTESGYMEDYQRTIRTDRWKLIYVPHENDRVIMRGDLFELYDVLNDPEEIRNVIDEHPAVAESLKTELFDWMENIAVGAAAAEIVTDLDEDTEALLRALGYID